jgi:hypothetical protein
MRLLSASSCQPRSELSCDGAAVAVTGPRCVGNPRSRPLSSSVRSPGKRPESACEAQSGRPRAAPFDVDASVSEVEGQTSRMDDTGSRRGRGPGCSSSSRASARCSATGMLASARERKRRCRDTAARPSWGRGRRGRAPVGLTRTISRAVPAAKSATARRPGAPANSRPCSSCAPPSDQTACRGGRALRAPQRYSPWP